jgi:hypothetical protein
MDRQVTINVTIGRRGIRAIVMGLVVLALAIPATVLASHSFTDVLNSNPFHADIAAIKDRGISPTGCGGGNYCPDANVTRGQMAAFINRVFSAEGTVMAYATVDADATVRESYTRNFGAVSVAHTLTGYYKVTFGGLTIRPDQAITITPRETFGIEQCFTFQGDSNQPTVEIFCHTAEPGSVAANVAFTVVVFN